MTSWLFLERQRQQIRFASTLHSSEYTHSQTEAAPQTQLVPDEETYRVFSHGLSQVWILCELLQLSSEQSTTAG